MMLGALELTISIFHLSKPLEAGVMPAFLYLENGRARLAVLVRSA
jgi:hypothetical protein